MTQTIIQTNNKLENLPLDLAFIAPLDIPAMKEMVMEKYSQRTNRTTFQEYISKKKFSGTQVREYIKEYDISEESLFAVYAKLEEKAISNGIVIEYLDMSGFSEDEYYDNEHTDEDHQRHAETARSDGKTLVLEKDLVKAGGITGRLYDLLHLAFGHIVQWSTTDTAALLTKEETWSIGYRNHEGSPDKVLDLMALYEFEAGMMGVNALQQIVGKMDTLSNEEKENIIQYFTDYVYADSTFIIQHYRGNKNKFEKYFKAGHEVPPMYDPYFVPVYIKRHAVEIGLIRDKQK